LSCVGYVTRQITSRHQGCSEYLLYAHTYTLKCNQLHLQCHLASGPILQSFRSRPVPLYQLYVDSVEDTTRQGSILCVQQPFRERLVSSVVTQQTFHLWGNAFVDSAIPTQWRTVIMLPWKCLLQTRYIIHNLHFRIFICAVCTEYETCHKLYKQQYIFTVPTCHTKITNKHKCKQHPSK
jgi:hypothetical protein